MGSKVETNQSKSVENPPFLSEQRVRCRLIESVLEVRSDTIDYYNIDQDNYCLLEIEDAPLDCNIKISAQWGPMPFQLTTKNRAKKIVCDAGFGWNVSYIEKSNEDYWLLTRTEENSRNYSLLYVRFSNLIVYNEGIARLRLCYAAEGREGPFSYVQLQKTSASLRIECFEPEEGTVNPAQRDGEKNAALNWCVMGAERCVLNPGNIEVPPVGSMTVSVAENSLFTLTAFYQQKSVEKSTIIYTYEEVWHDLFLVSPHKYYADCPTVIRWKLQGQVSDVQLWTRGKKLGNNLEAQGEFEDKGSVPEYVLSFQREGKLMELIYEREPDARQVVILFEAIYEERQDAFCVKWETFGTRQVELFVFFRKQNTAKEENVKFVNSNLFVKISSELNGEERWRLEHEKGFPVLFILRTVNSWGEEVEKHVECRG